MLIQDVLIAAYHVNGGFMIKLSMLEPLVSLLFVDVLVLSAVSTTFICAKPNPLLPSGCCVRWFLLYV